jgi:hypothetical protein
MNRIESQVVRLLHLRVIGHRSMKFAAVISWSATIVCATEIPYAADAIATGKAAGGLDPASIWAIVAIAMFAVMIALGYGVFTIGTKLQTALAVLSADVKARGNCQMSETVNALVSTARTEIELCGRRMRGE